MTADSSTATITPSGDHGTDGDGAITPTSAGKTLPSPWVHIVRGAIEPDSIAQSPSLATAVADPVTAVEAPVLEETAESSDGGNSGNAGGVMKSVWSKPLVNGVVEVMTSPVMGAELWPPLSESTRPGVKSSSVSYLESSSAVAAAVSQAPVTSQQPPKQVKPNLNPHANPNHAHHARPKSGKRGGTGTGPGSAGGVSGGASSGYIRPPQPPPLPPPFPIFDMYGNLLPAIPEPPQPPFKANNWSPRPVENTSNRHTPARRNNFGPRPFNNGRREHHGPRSPANARDVNVPHQMGPPPPPPFRGYFRPAFVFPQPVRPYGAQMGYEMGGSYVYFPALAPVPYRGGAPVFSHGATVSSVPVSSADLYLHDEIVKQIEYYFSDDNLVKDNFLRSHMDEEGWVPITLIAGFPKVQALTNDTQMLSSVLKDSSTVEIQDDKVRRRDDWKRWIHTRHEVTETSVEEASLQKLTLENGPTNEEQVLPNGDVSIEDPCS